MRPSLLAGAVVCAVAACGPVARSPSGASPASGDPTASTPTAPGAINPVSVVSLNVLFVHGVEACLPGRPAAANALQELETAMNAALPAQVAAYEAAHPGVQLVIHTARASLYTAPSSPYRPSSSVDPTDMDSWAVGSPGSSSTRQGDPGTTAFEWRYRLAGEIKRRFPADAKNVLLVGHSTGARTAFEVAANVGPGSVPGSADWGVKDRIVGVVSVNGMLDALNSPAYNFIGPTSFDFACRNGNALAGLVGQCLPGPGWCEYAGDVSALQAADQVAQEKHALELSSWGDCSVSLWTGQSDGELPFDAQGSPLAPGLGMTPAPGKTWRPSNGEYFGPFCHGNVAYTGPGDHAGAVASATQHILDFLFVKAPRVKATNMFQTPVESFESSSPVYPVGATCSAGAVPDAVQVAGVCHHSGYFDGDDHAIDPSEIALQPGAGCSAQVQWTQAHDPNNPHPATLWYKTLELPPGGGLVSTLKADSN